MSAGVPGGLTCGLGAAREGGMLAVRAGTTEGADKYCLGAVAWGDMALWCYCRDRVLCSRVHCDGEVLDSDQEGPVRSREKGQQRRECVLGGIHRVQWSVVFSVSGHFHLWQGFFTCSTYLQTRFRLIV